MKLNATFGAGYKIYQNDVEQGFKEPCFFIAVLKPDIFPVAEEPIHEPEPAGCSLFPNQREKQH